MVDFWIDEFKRSNDVDTDLFITNFETFVMKVNSGKIITADIECMYEMCDGDCYCLCHPGVKSLIPILRKFYVCQSCQAMKCFTKLDGCYERNFKPDYGFHRTEMMKIEKQKAVISKILRDKDSEDRIAQHGYKLEVYREDRFSNSFILSLIISKILISNIKINLIEETLHCFICNDYSYKLIYSSSFDNITSIGDRWMKPGSIRAFTAHSKVIPCLKESVAENVLYQLVVFFDCLYLYGFYHSNPCLAKMKFDNKFLEFQYKGIRVNTDLKLTMTGLEHCGLCFNTGKVISLAPKEFHRIEFFLPYIEKSIDNKYVKVSEKIINEMNEYYINLLGDSFNFACFSLILMSYPPFLRAVKGGKMYELWKGLWHEDQIDEVEKRISENIFETREDIFSFLNGKWIRLNWISENIDEIGRMSTSFKMS